MIFLRPTGFKRKTYPKVLKKDVLFRYDDNKFNRIKLFTKSAVQLCTEFVTYFTFPCLRFNVQTSVPEFSIIELVSYEWRHLNAHGDIPLVYVF